MCESSGNHELCKYCVRIGIQLRIMMLIIIVIMIIKIIDQKLNNDIDDGDR